MRLTRATPNIWQFTADPTADSDNSLGVLIGDTWINTATGNEFRCISSAIGAARWRFVPRLLASGGGLSHTGDTNETIMATVALAADTIGIGGVLRATAVVDAGANNANAKSYAVKFGAAGSGTGGTSFRSSSLASVLTSREQTQIQVVGAANVQIGGPAGQAGGWGTAAGARVTGAIDTTAASEINLTLTLANGADTITIQSYSIELLRPDITA